MYGTQSINIGEEELQAHLRRASAALEVVATETNGNAFGNGIDSMWVYIGGIYSDLNYFSAQPEGTFKTVEFGMSPVPTVNNGAKNSFLSFHPARLRLSRYLSE